MMEQRALYAQGRKALDEVNSLRKTAGMAPITTNENRHTVTDTMDSLHLIQSDGYGHAFDIVIYIDGKPNWSEKYYNEVGDVAHKLIAEKGYKVKWGGDFTGSFKDRPHYQRHA